MRDITPTTAASVRSSRAKTIARASWVLALLCSLVAVAGFPIGLAGVMVGVLTGSLALRRILDCGDLVTIGDRPTGDIAAVAPTLPPELSAPAILARLARRPDAERWLVASDDGWRVASRQLLLDTALVATDPVPVAHLARQSRWVDPETPVNRLPRRPAADEVWLVRGSTPPKILRGGDLLRAVREVSAPAATNTRVTA